MKVAVLTNILTPYRIPLFEAMRDRVDSLRVLLMAEREENRDWTLGNVSFEHEVLPGLHVKLPGADVSVHWNRGVIRALRRAPPDIVLSGGFAPANAVAWLYCRARRRPFIGWGELTAREALSASAWRRGVRRALISGSDGAIASSSDARDAFLLYGASEPSVLTAVMPVDVEYFHSRAVTHRDSPWCQGERARYASPILLSVGRLTERKGFRELFALYAEVLRSRPNVTLLIAGDGPERQRYEAYVRAQAWTRVHFLGFQQAESLTKYLSLADVFLFHTLSDPFGAVLSEAMAAELPPVASVYAAATRDLIHDGVTGFRIDPRDAQASARTILRVLQMAPRERAAIGAAAYARVKQFDIRSTADAMVGFMASVLERRRSGAPLQTAAH